MMDMGLNQGQAGSPTSLGPPVANPTWPMPQQDWFNYQQGMAEATPGPYGDMIRSQPMPGQEPVPEDPSTWRRLMMGVGAGLAGQPGLVLGALEEQRREQAGAKNRNLVATERGKASIQDIAMEAQKAEERKRVREEKAATDYMKEMQRLQERADKQSVQTQRDAEEREFKLNLENLKQTWITKRKGMPRGGAGGGESPKESPDEKDSRVRMNEFLDDLERVHGELVNRKSGGPDYKKNLDVPNLQDRKGWLETLQGRAKLASGGDPEKYAKLMDAVRIFLDVNYPIEPQAQPTQPTRGGGAYTPWPGNG